MDYDLIIIGSGPGGYVAAIRAGQVGLKTALVEKNKIGGMCLHWDCIPSKVLLENAKKMLAVKEPAGFGVSGIDLDKLTFDWKTALKRSQRIVRRLSKGVEYLLKKNGVEIIPGEAEITSENSVSAANRLLETKNIIIATGSRPAKPAYEVPRGAIIEIEEFLRLETLPQRACVLGSGPHTVELAQFFNLIGREVKLLVPGEQLLPGGDPYLEDYIKKTFKKSKIELKEKGDGNIEADGIELDCDLIINAALRRAVLPPAKIELALDNGFIKVNDYMQTDFANIYAVGDVNGRSYLAHAASAQGLQAVDMIKGIKAEYKDSAIPMNMYTYPEMAQVGLSEPEIQARGSAYKVSEFPLSANGKALAEGHSEGIVRVLADKKYGEVLGVQVIAQHATDMIAEAAAVLKLEGTIFDVAKTVHAHPTVSEVFMEAGFAAFDQPIHK